MWVDYFWPAVIAMTVLIGFYMIYNSLQNKMSNNMLKQKFTLSEIKKFDERNSKRYMAVDGLVFNVTDAEFYKPGGPYSLFVGRDASVALAKMSFEPQWLEVTLKDVEMNEVERINLVKWRKRLIGKKYPIVGELVYEEHYKNS